MGSLLWATLPRASATAMLHPSKYWTFHRHRSEESVDQGNDLLLNLICKELLNFFLTNQFEEHGAG